jgi:DNA-binding NtrC family response regulator
MNPAERESAALATAVPQLFMLLRYDDLHLAPSRHALASVDEVRFGRGEKYAVERRVDGQVRRLDVSIPDSRMSRIHAQLRRTPEGWRLNDSGSSHGSRLDGARVQTALLRDGAYFELGHTMFRFRTAVPTPAAAASDLTADELANRPPILRTLLPELGLSFERLVRAARSEQSISLIGHAGTGRECFARAAHEFSGRSGAFVILRCAAVPVGLVESILYGHVAGAFPGATDDALGSLRAAEGGTLFLDDAGTASPELQAALVRALVARKVVPVGGSRAIPFDVRLVSASLAPLLELSERARFHGELVAQLAGFSFEPLPLTERIEDLGLMTTLLAPELEQRAGATVTLHPAVARRLFAHPWSGGVRELRHALVDAAALADSHRIELPHLASSLGTHSRARAAASSAGPAGFTLEDQLIELFREHRGNVSRVARALGKARVQIQRWMKRYRIDPAKFR